MQYKQSRGYEPRFDLDLQVGQAGEKYVADSLEAFLAGNPRIEVKVDRKALDTGNLYLEFECKGKPSGLATTEADLVIFVVGEYFIAIKADTVRAIMFLAITGPSRSKGYIRSLTRGSHPTRGVCYPLNDVLLAAAQADQTLTQEYRDLIRESFRDGRIHA